jgi:hypothetical protein
VSATSARPSGALLNGQSLFGQGPGQFSVVHQHQHIGLGAQRNRVQRILLALRSFSYGDCPVRRRQGFIGNSRGDDPVVHQVDQRTGDLDRVAWVRRFGRAQRNAPRLDGSCLSRPGSRSGLFRICWLCGARRHRNRGLLAGTGRSHAESQGQSPYSPQKYAPWLVPSQTLLPSQCYALA